MNGWVEGNESVAHAIDWEWGWSIGKEGEMEKVVRMIRRVGVEMAVSASRWA